MFSYGSALETISDEFRESGGLLDLACVFGSEPDPPNLCFCFGTYDVSIFPFCSLRDQASPYRDLTNYEPSRRMIVEIRRYHKPIGGNAPRKGWGSQ